MTLGEKIRALRTDKGYTQQVLADKAGILKKSLSTYESDQVEPGAISLKKIADALGVTADYLLGSTSVVLNNPGYVKVLNEIDKLPKKEKDALLTTIETFLAAARKAKKK